MKQAIIALAAIFAVFLSGCAQSGSQVGCGQVPPAKLANCIYVQAVMAQDPFQCYSLPDKNQRAACIKDASDPLAKTALQRENPSQRDSIFMDNRTAPAKGNGTIAAPAAPPAPPARAPAGTLGQCNLLSSPGKGNCLRALAVENRDIAICGGIGEETVRQNCIAQIAKMVKDPSICARLGRQSDLDLCNLYSKAGEG